MFMIHRNMRDRARDRTTTDDGILPIDFCLIAARLSHADPVLVQITGFTMDPVDVVPQHLRADIVVMGG